MEHEANQVDSPSDLPGAVDFSPREIDHPSPTNASPQMQEAQIRDQENDKKNALPFKGEDTIELPLTNPWRVKMAKRAALAETTDATTPFYSNPNFSVDEWAPGKPLEIFSGTWNMAQNDFNADEVGGNFITPSAHIIAICTQENGPYVGSNAMHKRWEDGVRALLPTYTRIAASTLWAVHMIILARTKDVFPFICEVHVDSVKTGSVNNALGNKGGVGIAFSLRLTGAEPTPVNAAVPQTFLKHATIPRSSVMTFLFIGAHLTAHQQNQERRNEDYLHIIKHMKLGSQGIYEQRFLKRIRRAARQAGSAPAPTKSPKIKSPKTPSSPIVSPTSSPFSLAGRAYTPLPSRDVTEEFDVCCFLGDLNYRINGTASAIRHIISNHSQLRAALTANDQLTQEIKKGIVFHGFEEMPLTFCPTYKLKKIKSGGKKESKVAPAPKPQPPKPRSPSQDQRDANETKEYDFCSDDSSEEVKRKCKYDPDHYQDGPKARMPAYCDRVLFKANFRTMNAANDAATQSAFSSDATNPSQHNPLVKMKLYTDVRGMTTSDHRPVAMFATVSTYAADSAGGHFETDDDPITTRVGC